MKSQDFHPSAGAHWRQLLYGKYRQPVGLSSSGLRPLVIIGGIRPPAGTGFMHTFNFTEKPRVGTHSLVFIGGSCLSESTDIRSMVFGTDSVLFLRH